MTASDLRFAGVGPHSVAYREAGQGQPLVLLHGFLCDSRCWRSQLSGLADAFRVVAWDAPGAGRSSDPPGTFTTADYARCLAEFLDAIAVERACLVGLSWGGILAQEFCRLHSHRLRRLVLADTYAGWKGSLPRRIWTERLDACLLDAESPPEAVVAKFLPGMFSDAAPPAVCAELSAIISAFHPVGFRLMALSSAQTDTRSLLPGIQVPVLVVCGEADRRSPVQISRRIHDAIPGSEFAVLPDAGHLSNMEQPDAFNDCVRRFCLHGDAQGA